MAEAAALTLAAQVSKLLSINQVDFLTDDEAMANFYNSNDLSNLHTGTSSDSRLTATFLEAMKDSQFKVHKIPRTMNNTANSQQLYFHVLLVSTATLLSVL